MRKDPLKRFFSGACAFMVAISVIITTVSGDTVFALSQTCRKDPLPAGANVVVGKGEKTALGSSQMYCPGADGNFYICKVVKGEGNGNNIVDFGNPNNKACPKEGIFTGISVCKQDPKTNKIEKCSGNSPKTVVLDLLPFCDYKPQNERQEYTIHCHETAKADDPEEASLIWDFNADGEWNDYSKTVKCSKSNGKWNDEKCPNRPNYYSEDDFLPDGIMGDDDARNNYDVGEFIGSGTSDMEQCAVELGEVLNIIICAGTQKLLELFDSLITFVTQSMEWRLL